MHITSRNCFFGVTVTSPFQILGSCPPSPGMDARGGVISTPGVGTFFFDFRPKSAFILQKVYVIGAWLLRITNRKSYVADGAMSIAMISVITLVPFDLEGTHSAGNTCWGVASF